MNEVMMLRETEPRKILSIVIEKKMPAIMSYLSNGKWHIVKVLLTDLGAGRLDVEICPRREPRPLNIRPEQPVGVSIKYEYGKFVFETTVISLEPSLPRPPGTGRSSEPAGSAKGGVVALAVPDRIEIIQRRSYFRVNVPWALKVNVVLWHRCHQSDNSCVPPDRYCQGRLVDISAGGAQVAMDTSQNQDFRKGQFVTLRFTPMPYETPLMFNAQIRSILPTADDSGICLGLQIVGLETSLEGRSILKRLCGIVERYYRINQSGSPRCITTGTGQQDIQAGNGVSLAGSRAS